MMEIRYGRSHVLATLVIGLAGLGGATEVPFSTQPVVTAFDGARCARPADLDGDGDVVGASLSGNAIAWWESDGTPANGG